MQRARGDELAERVRLANESARGHERRQEELAALRGALERASSELADLRESATQARDSFDAEIARLQEIARELEARAELARDVAAEASRDRDAAFAAREATEAGGRRLQVELSQAQIAAENRSATIEDLRFELESESRKLRELLADRERVRHAEVVNESVAGAFFSHVEAELARTRREIAHIDGLIRQVQNSKWWTVKRALGKARRIVAARLRR
ncbi:MAG: hypothetical protein IAI50_14590 [Candidatus Eremiobacteraeota bacterium]|nr:hypothetical protein [Candidatus Eremiobacteraeota bacterium]